jgi:CHAT domain-containing protein
LTRFGLKRRQLLLAIFLHLVLPFEIVGSAKFDELCDKELLKNKIDFTLARRYCKKAKEQALKRDSLEDISWYFLINGNFSENISKFENNKNNIIIYTNIAHSYLLLNNLKKAEEFYTKVIQVQSDLDDALQSDFKLLLRLYPQYNQRLKRGVKIWNRLYKPFIEINQLHLEYDKLKEQNKYDLAIKKLSDIILKKEKSIVKDRLAMMMDYYELGLLYEERKIYPKAIQNYKKSLEISERFLDKNHIHIGTICNSLGMIFSENRDFTDAERYFNKGLSIYKNWFDDTDIEIGIFYNNLGTLYKEMRKYSKAEYFFKKAIVIEEKHQSDEIADTYDNLGLTYQKMKKYKLALTYHRKALEVRKKQGAIETAISYSVLGLYYQEIENNLKALKYHKKALTIREKELGKLDMDTSETYHNLGATYEALKDYSRALDFYQKSLVINQELLDENDTDIAIVYNNISSCYNELGQYKEAERYISKSIIIKESVLKQDDIELALGYNNRGLIFEEMKLYDKAIDDYNHSIMIYRNNLTENSKEVAIGYNNLASLLNAKRDYKSSLKYLNKTKKILEKLSIDKQSTFMSTLYNNLGLLHEYVQDYEQAYKNNTLSFQIFLENIDKNFLTLDNKQKSKYLKSFGNRIDNLLNSAYLYKPLSKDTISIKKNIFNSWLKFKGTIFENQNLLSMIEKNPKTNTKTKQNIKELKKLTIQLDNLDNSDIKPKNYKEQKSKIEEQIHDIEVNLSQQNPRFQEQLDLQKISYQDISTQLKSNQLYIDFARGVNNYYIFTLDSRDNISFEQIDSNLTKSIDSNITEFLEINREIAENINNHKLIESLKPKTNRVLLNLYTSLIGQNIKEKKASELIISPDGKLNFLPFEALFNGKKYLLEDCTISYISSGREFIRQSKRKNNNTDSSKVVIFGTPNYEYGLEDKAKGGLITSLSNIDDFEPIDSSKEIEIIRRYYKNVEVYKDANATIENLMSITNPKILHISTHGFFFNDENITNPMRRSALALTSANDAMFQNNLKGIATALKLSSMELYSTELVVLSACETALGTAYNAEGVLGLPKAFIQAGAKKVIMSLWSVSEKGTALLMEKFYTHVHQGESYPLALRDAKLEMIKRHPYYWSAFIMSGI